jgi:predicted DNA-binding transcriptional regulator AlpA
MTAERLTEPTPRRRRKKRLRLCDRLTLDAAALARALGVGLRTVRAWDAAGRLPSPVALGARRLWPVEEIQAWLRHGAPCRQEWQGMRREVLGRDGNH